MSTTTRQTALDPSRVSDIARQIRGAVTPFLGANQAKVDKVGELQAAADGEVSMREAIMVSVAGLSQAGQWTQSEIGAAAGKAANMSNNVSEKALATFIGETKNAMHPRMRASVPDIINLRDVVWSAETEMRKLSKDAPAPLRKAFARSYHLMIAMFKEGAEGRMFATCQDVLDFAAERDPDLDLDKVKARLDKIRDQLVRFYADWPVDDIQVCVDALNEVDKKSLRGSRGEVSKPAHAVAESVPGNVVAGNVESEEGMADEENVSEGPDLLDDILGGSASIRLAA